MRVDLTYFNRIMGTSFFAVSERKFQDIHDNRMKYDDKMECLVRKDKMFLDNVYSNIVLKYIFFF